MGGAPPSPGHPAWSVSRGVIGLIRAWWLAGEIGSCGEWLGVLDVLFMGVFAIRQVYVIIRYFPHFFLVGVFHLLAVIVGGAKYVRVLSLIWADWLGSP